MTESTQTKTGSLKVAIIGSGNIGTDLLVKAMRSELIEPVWMVGIDPDSAGLAKAKSLGLKTTHAGIDDFLQQGNNDGVELAFDATSAYLHPSHNERLQAKGIRVIDLTPAAVGPYCVPPVNLDNGFGTEQKNLNMVTCGGQATIPIVAAVSGVQKVEYAEIVATIASQSAGPGTRKNIDEFTRTTATAIEMIGGAENGKAIIILNPAEPPMLMRDTVHCVTASTPNEQAITAAIRDMIATVAEYVPGYRLKNGPVFDGNRVSTFLEVEGLGDFLPKYAGNLDIMTAAALRTAEVLAQSSSSFPPRPTSASAI